MNALMRCEDDVYVLPKSFFENSTLGFPPRGKILKVRESGVDSVCAV